MRKLASFPRGDRTKIFTPLRAVKKHEIIGKQVAEQRKAGKSYESIARELGTTRATARVAGEFAIAVGQSLMPVIPVKEPFRKGKRLKPDVEAKIVAMRNDNVSFQEIACELGINPITVSRAFGHRMKQPEPNAASSLRPTQPTKTPTTKPG